VVGERVNDVCQELDAQGIKSDAGDVRLKYLEQVDLMLRGPSQDKSPP
jgi:hypothetical protein